MIDRKLLTNNCYVVEGWQMGRWLMILCGVISLLSGLFSMFAPETAWQMSEGWKYKNVQPSEMNLLMYRLGGVFTVLIGIGFCLGAQYVPAGR